VIYRCALILALAVLPACDGDTATNQDNQQPNECYEGSCTTNDLPFSQSADAPTLVDIKLECQPNSIVVLATVTDAQGTPNLLQINQTIGVFPDKDCQETSFEVEDDLAGSGLEESFGDVVLTVENPDLYALICSCETWPAEVEFRDADGNTTTGRVVATVTD
jgi:hypothetical protein